jgi:hypothetical protein
LLRLSAVQHTGLLDAFVTAVMEVADPAISGLSPPNPAVVAHLLLTLLFLPVAGLARTWDLRSYTGTMLAILSGRERAYSQRYTERFLARLAHAGAAKRLTEVIARWTWSLWQAASDEPHAPAVFYVDGHRKAVYSDVLVPRGPVGKLDGKILGCRELVVLHDAQAHPLLATTHRGDQHLTIGLPQMLHCYEQATGQTQVQRVVVDREGMAAEFLAQLHQEGRQVVTRLGSDQYEGEGSFEQIGAWQPWRYNRAGQVICEVASARFTLPRPNPLDPPVQVEVALIRDWRKLLVVEQAAEALAAQDWQAELAPKLQRFWEEGWQALPAPPAPTTPKLIPVITTGHGMEAVELAHTYAETLELPRKCSARLADSAQFRHQSWICQRAGGEHRTGQTPTRGRRQTTPPGTPGTGVPCAVSPTKGTGSASRRASSGVRAPPRRTGRPGHVLGSSKPNGGAGVLSRQSTARGNRLGSTPVQGEAGKACCASPRPVEQM